LYDKVLIENTKPIDIQVKDVSIDEALDAVLNGLPLTYAIQNKIIVIKEKAPVIEKSKTELSPPPHDITGKVTNQHDEPLSGASVVIKRTKTGTITDANGKFTLRNVNPTDTLLISFIGYSTKRIPVGNEIGTSYRSAIFFTNESQREVANKLIAEMDVSGIWPGKIVTEVIPATDFWNAEAEHQDYLQKNPYGYTCHFERPDWKLD
jgi:hypothetical protein